MVGHGVSVTLISWTCCEKGQKRRRWFRIIVGGEGDEKDVGAAERRGG